MTTNPPATDPNPALESDAARPKTVGQEGAQATSLRLTLPRLGGAALLSLPLFLFFVIPVAALLMRTAMRLVDPLYNYQPIRTVQQAMKDLREEIGK